MDMYTLLCLEWITNKDPLYSTGNSAQGYVAAWLVEFGGEWIHIHIQLSRSVVLLKLSQHCSSAICQYKIKTLIKIKIFFLSSLIYFPLPSPEREMVFITQCLRPALSASSLYSLSLLPPFLVFMSLISFLSISLLTHPLSYLLLSVYASVF